MSAHVSAGRPTRPLVRAFCPSRLAADALAQSYERLFPAGCRRRPQPASPAARPLPRPRFAASG